MRGFKIVACYLFAIAVVIALQLSVYTGIFLMMAMGAAWAALLFNGMLLHLAIEVLRRRIAAAWLALPVAIYGAWGVFAAMDYAIAARMRADFEAAASAIAKSSPPPHDVVVEAADASRADSMAASLIKLVDGVRVFANGSEFFLLPITDERCRMLSNPQIRNFLATQSNQRSKKPLNEPYDRCVIATKADVPEAALVLMTEATGQPYGANNRLKRVTDDRDMRLYVEVPKLAPTDVERLKFAQRTRIKRRDASGELVEAGAVVQGKIEYLSPIPFFAAGCGLNSGNPSWDCFFTLWKQQMDVGTAKGFHWMMPGGTYYLAQKAGLPLRE